MLTKWDSIVDVAGLPNVCLVYILLILLIIIFWQGHNDD